MSLTSLPVGERAAEGLVDHEPLEEEAVLHRDRLVEAEVVARPARCPPAWRPAAASIAGSAGMMKKMTYVTIVTAMKSTTAQRTRLMVYRNIDL